MACFTALWIYKKELTIQIIVILALIHYVVSISEYEMENYCDDEISFISEYLDQLKLELDDDGIFGRKTGSYFSSTLYTCETTIEAWYSTYPKLMFYFEDLNLDCDDGHLEFYNGKTNRAHVSGLEGHICGQDKPQGVYAVDSRYFRIKYIPSKKQYIDDIFSIIITTYNDGYCASYAHECKNSRCIDKDLACNGYNSCGDGSGCDLSTGVVIGIVIGSLAGLALIVSCVVCCICCTRRSQQTPGVVQRPAQSQVTYTASSQQGITQPTYGVNHGPFYPNNQAPALPYYTNQAPYPVMSPNTASSEQQSSFPNPVYDGPPAYNELFRNEENGESQQPKDGRSDASYANIANKTGENQYEEIRS